ncbi:MAG: hypothetical protein GQ574_16200 [Crocinitomix sp.]|nr:hypothetical protein [Crocinitomix sp.]
MGLFSTLFKLLTFRITRAEMLKFETKHLILAIAGAWLVGVGRYWDDSRASDLQHLGLGSVIYIFLLAAFIWIIVLPFKVEGWDYKVVLTFIGLTSLPAVFYAIPVEQFLSMKTANSVNVWFLAIVAIWRLALLFYFLRIFTRLGALYIVTIALMPICLIISVLTMLNLHRVVFDIMRGMHDPTPHDDSYFVLMLLTVVSLFLAIPLIISYVVGIVNRHKDLKNAAEEEQN